MLTPEQGFSKIDSIVGYDLLVIVQMIDKLLSHGLVSGKELNYIACLRHKAIDGIKSISGIDVNNLTVTTAGILAPNIPSDNKNL